MGGYGVGSEALVSLNVHWHGACWHFGHLPLYFSRAAFSRSIPVMLAREASQAITSANSLSVSFLFPISIASRSSSTSSLSQSIVPLIPRSESLWKYSWRIMFWNSRICISRRLGLIDLVGWFKP